MKLDTAIDLLKSHDGDMFAEGYGCLSLPEGFVAFDAKAGTLTIDLNHKKDVWEKIALIENALKRAIKARVMRIFVEPIFSYNYHYFHPTFKYYHVAPKYMLMDGFKRVRGDINIPDYLRIKYSDDEEGLFMEEQEIIMHVLRTYRKALGIKHWRREAASWHDKIMYIGEFGNGFELELTVENGSDACKIVRIKKLGEEIDNEDGEYVIVNGKPYRKTTGVDVGPDGKFHQVEEERKIICSGE